MMEVTKYDVKRLGLLLHLSAPSEGELMVAGAADEVRRRAARK